MDQEAPLPALNPGAKRLLETALDFQREHRHDALGTFHWLLALLDRHSAMAQSLAEGIEPGPLSANLRTALRQGRTGEPLSKETVLERALARSRAERRERVVERDLGAVILAASGFRLTARSDQGPKLATTSNGPTSDGPSSILSRRPTPTLQQFGRDLIREAREGLLGELVGREREIELVIETLCRRTKRNPVLVGPAGAGKTAIVEGLAYRIATDQVPQPLRNAQLYLIQPSVLVAGAHLHGEFEKRMKALLAEASQPGIILFIDEVHSVIGAGGTTGTGDFASLLKPALARGELACIAATTDSEYRRYIEPDAALERRFQSIRVQELTPEQTIAVLDSWAAELAQSRGVNVSPAVRRWLVDFAARYRRNLYFPDKAVDLLDQCVAHAVAHGKSEVDLADAEAVALQIVGLPARAGLDFDLLGAQLGQRTALHPDDVTALVTRLGVTVRGLDTRPSRPNAIVLLAGTAADQLRPVAEVLAEGLYGSANRIILIDFGRFVDDYDISQLLGSSRGFVGYGDELPLHRVAQMPGCVLACLNVHACHPQVRAVLAQGLAEGFLTDTSGKRVYLSEAVVLLTSAGGSSSRSVIGFGEKPAAQDGAVARAIEAAHAMEDVVGSELSDQLDLVCTGVRAAGAVEPERWIQDNLLAALATRYLGERLAVSWDPAVARWLSAQAGLSATSRDWERLVDARIAPLLIPFIPPADGPAVRRVSVRCIGDQLVVEPDA